MISLAPTAANTPLRPGARACGGVAANGGKQMGSREQPPLLLYH